MHTFKNDIQAVADKLDMAYSASDAIFPKNEKLLTALSHVAGLFVYFLEIHPYANGNGHMARMMLLAMLARHNLVFVNFPVHPRPDGPFADLIKEYRSGNHTALVSYLVKRVRSK